MPEAPVGEVVDPVAEVRVRLDELAERPLDEHVAGYDQVHRLLQDRLATLDEA